MQKNDQIGLEIPGFAPGNADPLPFGSLVTLTDEQYLMQLKAIQSEQMARSEYDHALWYEILTLTEATSNDRNSSNQTV